jgi:hypothetical protein
MERIQAFHTAFHELQNRISISVNLPFKSRDKLKLQKKLDEIGRMRFRDSENTESERNTRNGLRRRTRASVGSLNSIPFSVYMVDQINLFANGATLSFLSRRTPCDLLNDSCVS